MSMFTLAIFCWPLIFALIPGPNIPGFYTILLFTASDFSFITSCIHNWILFLLWLHLFILSGVISSLISSTISGTYQPGEFIFQCPIFLPFHTVHGALKARILKWFAIPFSTGRRFVRTQTSPDGQYWHQIDYILCSQRWRSSIQSAKTRPGANFHSDHELLIANFRLNLKKGGKTTRPFRYDLN